MSLTYRCRLCLKSTRNKVDIFKDDFPKMIEILTGVEVDPYDDFPKTSCIDCARNVKISIKTRKQIIRSHNVLLEEFLAKCKTEISESHVDESQSDIIEDVNKVDEFAVTKNKLETSLPTLKLTRNRLKLAKSVQSEIETSRVVSDMSSSVKEEIDTYTSSVDIRESLIMNYDPGNSNNCDAPSPMSDPASDVGSTPDKEEQEEPSESVKDDSKSTKPLPKSSDGESVKDDSKSTKLLPKSSDGVFFVKKRKTPARNVKDDSKSTKPLPKSSDGEPVKDDSKSTKPLPKSSDGVFFVKKRKTPSINAKSPDTVVRIKKKARSRVPPKRVTCDICKREVQSYWLQKHMETHEYNPVTCEFCGLVSKSATALRHHVFYYHRSAADEYMCDQCGRSFRSKYRLNLHKKKEHGGTKDFECTTCGKKFFERMHLKRHVDKTHKNIRPYMCDFCGKSFKSKNHIKIHERIHSKEAPYNCHMCGESFKMKLTLRTHLKGIHNVHEEQNVFCDICRRGFATDVALKAHLNSRIHETEKCQYCSEMFTREYMINHLRDVHGMGATVI